MSGFRSVLIEKFDVTHASNSYRLLHREPEMLRTYHLDLTGVLSGYADHRATTISHNGVGIETPLEVMIANTQPCSVQLT